MPLPDDFPVFPDHPAGSSPICFINAAYVNDLRKRRSSIGYAIILAGGAIAWDLKTQSTPTLSSTKADFNAVVFAAKVFLFLHHVLNCLGQPPTGRTLFYEDNEACINVINTCHPTDYTQHIETPYFKIQDWKEQEVIKLIYIPGIINNSDDLTKPLGWFLHSQHTRCTTGHFIPSTFHRLL